MKRIPLTLLLLGLASVASAQNSRDPRLERENALQRKKDRDLAVEKVGDSAIAFCRDHGEIAAQVLLKIEAATGKRLAELHAAGELDKIDMALLLAALWRHGEPSAAWVVENHAMLNDRTMLKCFCAQPLDYAWNLRSLPQDAAAVRAKTAVVPVPITETLGTLDWKVWLVIVAGVVVLALLIKWKRSAAPA